jgi:hypothetical protein
MDPWEQAQLEMCRRFGVTPLPCLPSEKVGIARNVREGVMPIHGMRIAPEGGTCGWYIYAGEVMSEDEDFFVPLHVAHLASWSTLVIPYLSLPPGWRFLVTDVYEDVWQHPCSPIL